MLLRLSDRWLFGGLAAIAAAMILLAAVWPQGVGARSPAPFGHAVTIPDYVRVDARKAEARRQILRRAQAAQEGASGGIQAPEAVPTPAPVEAPR
jgi:hypothetical protein